MAFDGIQLTSNDGAFTAHEHEARHSRLGPLAASDASMNDSMSPSVKEAGSPSRSVESGASPVARSRDSDREHKLISPSSSIGFDRVTSTLAHNPTGAGFTAHISSASAESKDKTTLSQFTPGRKRHTSHTALRGYREKIREILDLIGAEDDPGCCCNGCCTTVRVYSFSSGCATLFGVVIEILKNTKNHKESRQVLISCNPIDS